MGLWGEMPNVFGGFERPPSRFEQPRRVGRKVRSREGNEAVVSEMLSHRSKKPNRVGDMFDRVPRTDHVELVIERSILELAFMDGQAEFVVGVGRSGMRKLDTVHLHAPQVGTGKEVAESASDLEQGRAGDGSRQVACDRVESTLGPRALQNA